MLTPHNRTVGYVPQREPDQPPLREDEVLPHDWTARLSLEMIRTHTKNDDVPGVTDEQLKLYRATAIEAAEMYTGLLLSGQRTVIEPIEGPHRIRPGKMTYRYRLKYPSADGIIHLYGSPYPQDNRAFVVPIGSRKIDVPVRIGMLDMSNCCDPCSVHKVNQGMMAAYRAGYKCPADVPSGVVQGCLMFIAWSVEHPGDELIGQRNRIEARSVGVDGSNNVAWVSGAVEMWRLYDDEAF